MYIPCNHSLPLGLVPKHVDVFLFSPTRAKCTAHLIHLFAVQH